MRKIDQYSKITSTLTSIETNSSQTDIKLAKLMRRICELDMQLDNKASEKNLQFNLLKEKLSKLSQGIHEDLQSQLIEDDSQLKEVQRVDKQIDSLIQSRLAAIADNEDRITRSIEDKFRSVRDLILIERAERTQQLQELEEIAKEAYEDIIGRASQENTNIAEADEQIHHKIEENSEDILVELAEQKSSRISYENGVRDLLETMTIKIQEELEIEREAKQLSEATILSKLELLYLRIEELNGSHHP